MGFKFENLIIWQKAIDLSDLVNIVAKRFPKEETYVLAPQIKKAADSVALNISEGSTGQSNPDFRRFLGYAYRSNIEVVCCIYLAKRRQIISDKDFKDIYQKCEELSIMIYSLRSKLK